MVTWEQARFSEAAYMLDYLLARGVDVTAATLMWAARLQYRILGPERPIPVAAGDVAYVDADGYQEFDPYEHFQLGVARQGVYVVAARRPEDGAEFSVNAHFIPEGADSFASIVELLYFDLVEHRSGRDLLARRYREDRESTHCQDVIEKLVTDVVQLAEETVSEHLAGRFTTPPDNWFRSVPPEFADEVSRRSYPRRRVLTDDLLLYEDWVAVIPGRGIVRAGSNGFGNVFDYFAEDGTYGQGVPAWVDPATLFRPSDELSDPGLAERFEHAARLAARPVQCGPAADGPHVDF